MKIQNIQNFFVTFESLKTVRTDFIQPPLTIQNIIDLAAWMNGQTDRQEDRRNALHRTSCCTLSGFLTLP